MKIRPWATCLKFANNHQDKDYNHTLYSVVYNLTDKSMDIVVGENYVDGDMTFHFDLLKIKIKKNLSPKQALSYFKISFLIILLPVLIS